MNQLQAIILAGERAGGNPLALELGVPAGVLVPVHGRTCLDRVLDCLTACQHISDGIVCGPDANVLVSQDELGQRLSGSGAFTWCAPATGPAASALTASQKLEPGPKLLTSGDHALLSPQTVDAFCKSVLQAQAGAKSGADIVVGLVPYAQVKSAFPDSRRTLLQFADGTYCGSNLFLLLTPDAKGALEFWQSLETQRKHPWKIAARLGVGTLLRYLFHQLTVDQAMARLSELAGCKVDWITVDDPRAAVDVDSHADWMLAEQILGNC